MLDDKDLARLRRAENEIESALEAIAKFTKTMTSAESLPESTRSAYSAKCRRARKKLQDMYWQLQELEHKLDQ